MRFNKSSVWEEISQIIKEKGHGYFIVYPAQSSQKFTGERDYYHIIYEINYINSIGAVENTTASRKYELESDMDNIGARYIISIDVVVEHIVDRDIVYEDKVIIGTVKSPIYEQYKHKLR